MLVRRVEDRVLDVTGLRAVAGEGTPASPASRSNCASTPRACAKAAESRVAKGSAMKPTTLGAERARELDAGAHRPRRQVAAIDGHQQALEH